MSKDIQSGYYSQSKSVGSDTAQKSKFFFQLQLSNGEWPGCICINLFEEPYSLPADFTMNTLNRLYIMVAQNLQKLSNDMPAMT